MKRISKCKFNYIQPIVATDCVVFDRGGLKLFLSMREVYLVSYSDKDEGQYNRTIQRLTLKN